MLIDPEHFWSRVDRSGGPDACWPWIGGHLPGEGYGRYYCSDDPDRGYQYAHRLAFLLVNGWAPSHEDGNCVRHTCDFRPCCNPAHIVGGTIAENNRDKALRGRSTKGRPVNVGEANGLAKLTAEQVREIRVGHDTGRSQRALARDFGVSQTTVHHIVHGRYWRHLLEAA